MKLIIGKSVDESVDESVDNEVERSTITWKRFTRE